MIEEVSIAAGSRDAMMAGLTWSHTDLALTMRQFTARTGWLQFLLFIPRNSTINSATLTVMPSTSPGTPHELRVSWVALYDGDLATDRSALLASLQNKITAPFTGWTAGNLATADVTSVIAAWAASEGVPTDDSGAYCTLVLEGPTADHANMNIYAEEAVSGLPAKLTVDYTPPALPGSAVRRSLTLGMGVGM